jgi:hypothetical protein
MILRDSSTQVELEVDIPLPLHLPSLQRGDIAVWALVSVARTSAHTLDRESVRRRDLRLIYRSGTVRS